MAKKKSAPRKSAKKPDIKIETIPARHEFTDNEKGELGIKLAGLTQEKTRVEEEKKVAMQQWTTRIKTIQNDISATSGKISSGFEMRDTECEVRYDWKGGEKTYFRKSDQKKIETRKIEEHERQQKLFAEEQEKKSSALKPGDNIVSVKDAIREAEADAKNSESEDEEQP